MKAVTKMKGATEELRLSPVGNGATWRCWRPGTDLHKSHLEEGLQGAETRGRKTSYNDH